MNIISLLIFTLCEAYFVSFICAMTALQSGTQVVVVAAVMTFGKIYSLCRNCLRVDHLRHIHTFRFYNKMGNCDCNFNGHAHAWNILHLCLVAIPQQSILRPWSYCVWNLHHH